MTAELELAVGVAKGLDEGHDMLALPLDAVEGYVAELEKAKASADYYWKLVQQMRPYFEKSPAWAKMALSARGHAGGKARHRKPPDPEHIARQAAKALLAKPEMLSELEASEAKSLKDRIMAAFPGLDKADGDEDEAGVVCPECGEAIPVGEDTCPECGHVLEEAEE
jgi:hypothetical protein